MRQQFASNSPEAAARYSPFAIRHSPVATCVPRLLFLPSSCSTRRPPPRPQSAQEVQKVAEQVIRRLDLQTKLPTEPERQRTTLKLPPEVLWVVIAVALGVLHLCIPRHAAVLANGAGGGWSADETAPGDAAGRPPEVVLGAADELAARGPLCRSHARPAAAGAGGHAPAPGRAVRRFAHQPRNPAPCQALRPRGRRHCATSSSGWNGPISASVPPPRPTIRPAGRASARLRRPCARTNARKAGRHERAKACSRADC